MNYFSSNSWCGLSKCIRSGAFHTGWLQTFVFVSFSWRVIEIYTVHLTFDKYISKFNPFLRGLNWVCSILNKWNNSLGVQFKSEHSQLLFNPIEGESYWTLRLEVESAVTDSLKSFPTNICRIENKSSSSNISNVMTKWPHRTFCAS